MTEKIEKTSTIFEKNASEKPDFLVLANELISDLPVRSQDILKKRFGLLLKERETLEKIGQDYKITRERVRQIITDAIKNVSKKLEGGDLKQAEELLIFTIRKNNGIIKEKDILTQFSSGNSRQENALLFFVECSKEIASVFEKGVVEKSWVLSKDSLVLAKKIHVEAQNVLAEEKKLLKDEEILEKISKKIPGLKKDEIFNHLMSLSQVKKNIFGKWGMKHWDEVSPKGTREKIHLVLKETKKPLHFTEIAALIDKHKLGKKKAHPQTVHNELIKDSRFVLIGRGIYALKQWGYKEGTIKDVLKNILEKSQKPLSKDEIVSEVMKIRKVKKTTVMINLNNSKIFEKKEDLYSVRK